MGPVRSGSPGLVANKHLNLPGVCRHASSRDPIWESGIENKGQPENKFILAGLMLPLRLAFNVYHTLSTKKVFFFICLVI